MNPSPWWLQYVNSIWLQNSADIGFADNIEQQAQVDKEITFRDARYFNLLNTRAIQMPLKHIYNHEPIYGSYAKVSYTDEEFEKYIYCCSHLSLIEEDRMLSLPVIRQVAASANKPFFIAGDMNAHPGSEFIRQLQNDFVILTDTKKPTFPANNPLSLIHI